MRDQVNLRVLSSRSRVSGSSDQSLGTATRSIRCARRAAGCSIGLGNGRVSVFCRPGLPEGLLTLLVLIGDVVGFGIFEDEPVEADFQNPGGHGSSDLFVAEAQDRIA